MISKISSLTNNKIKELRKLKDKKYRNLTETFLIEGVRFIDEAMRQSAKIHCLIVEDEKLLEDLKEFKEYDQLQGIDILMVSSEIMKEMSQTVSPQGMIAQVGFPHLDPLTFKQDQGLWLYLDEIRDPGNLGTIIRTAHAFAVDGVILSKGCADPYQDKVLRSTMGSIFKTPLLIHQSIDFLTEQVEAGTSLYLADLENAQQLPGIKPDAKSLVVIGSEAHGVSEAIRALPHHSVMIPMLGGAESLNAAVAAALVLYEFKGRG